MQKRRTLQALVDQLAGLAARQPVLALYEDVHWIDPSTLELLGLVIERVRQLPVLVLITFRPEFQPPWTGQAHVTSLTMSRLGRRQGADLVARVTGEQAAAGGDRRADRGAHRRRAAVRRGADQDRAGIGPAGGRRRPLRADRPAAAARDPDDAARLADGPARPPRAGQGGRPDRRRDRPRVLATSCSLRSRLCPKTALGEALGKLVASELIFRRGSPPDATYTFKHALVQDAAYQSLLK